MSCPSSEMIVRHFLNDDRDNPLLRKLNAKHIRSCTKCLIKHESLRIATEIHFGERPKKKRRPRPNPELN